MISSPLSARDRRALRIAAAVLLPVLLWTSAIGPAVRELRARAAAVDTSRGLLERELGIVAEAPRYPALAAAGAERLRGMGARLLDGATTADAGAALGAVLRDGARASQVRVTALDPLAATDTGGLRTVAVRLQGESDLEGVLLLLRRLEEGSPLVHVGELEIEPAAAPAAEVEVLSIGFVARGFTLAPLQPGRDAAPTTEGGK